MSRYHGKAHRSFDSEGTSIGVSPPLSPPRHPVYFVQSPSRSESQDGEKPSFHSTPLALSPTASPLHYSFSTDAVRTAPKPGSRRVLPQPTSGVASIRQPSQKKGYVPWTPGTIIEEEEQLASSAKKKGLSRWCMFLISFLFCILLLTIGALIFWLVCQPHSPRLLVKDVMFKELEVVPGTDEGVPTRVLTVNCTILLTLSNPSQYFGVHVSASEIDLVYSELVVGTGQVPKFYQPKDSERTFSVNVAGIKLPLYGAGPSLQSITDAGGGVPFHLGGVLQSRAYVFWKFVKPKFRNYISCDVIVNSSGMAFLKLIQKACSYTRN
ncbi:hypothetical protein O6H91_01G160300 [Diphasiastrum complanatum]|uniref:Uncharacterized protein n=1 Tax=Diphasiastrum complanatum TaxID=34168 RepID=A0ACC2EXU1_DIPCM|nr:hypothetical protein O6H91_Y042300 [Diphasiastrum complanatum]KAJ7571346.1 hypothetical protein O6H91_01G160300 [Diphasiastrum complanatum]